jgi:O-antigen/teichoic acid export membrane protein
MTRGASLLRNTAWNLAGQLLPIAVGILAIPPLIHGLGAEKFGILAVGWLVMGYFAVFDLGLGRATTKFLAELGRTGDRERFSAILWTSVHLHAALGVVGGLLFAALTPWLAADAFNIPADLQAMTRGAFYWLAASIPFIVVSACLRGALEALNHFDAVNLVRIAGSVLNYLAPLVVLQLTEDLTPVIAVITCGRVLVLLALAGLALARLPEARSPRGVQRRAVRPLFAFGGWVTVSSLVAPAIMVADRVFIVGIFSVAALTYYVTPYEVVTKLWIFSASVMGALFPAMTSLAATDRGALLAVGARASRHLLALVTPIVVVLIAFGRELLWLWVGPDFAAQSTAIAKWLAFGVLLNVLAQVPITMAQAAGRPDLVARLQLLQLPPFLFLAWSLVNTFGSVGAAMAWAARAGLELALAWVVTRRAVGERQAVAPWGVNGRQGAIVAASVLGAWLTDSLWRADTGVKLILFVPGLALLVAWLWRVLLAPEERRFVIDWMRAATRHPRRSHVAD